MTWSAIRCVTAPLAFDLCPLFYSERGLERMLRRIGATFSIKTATT